MLAEAKFYARMAGGVWDYLSQPRLENPLDLLLRRVEQREEAFLSLVRQAAYEVPDSSWLRLLQLARCEYGDLETMVRRRGLEAALRHLAEAGVYITHDEFKGRVPLVRHGQEVPGGEAQFRNPLARAKMETRSSGSRTGGRGTPTGKTTAFQVYRDAHDALWEEEYGLAGAEWTQVRPILPSISGLSGTFRAWRRGRPMQRWFTVPTALKEAAHYRSATAAMVAVARLRGAQVPFPLPLPPNDFSPVARYIAGRKCVVLAFPSPAVRVAEAAAHLGLDLSGTLFISGGEATTPAKRAVVARSGARLCTNYHISEVGPIGSACRHLQTGNDIHLLMDSVAVISRRRAAPFSGEEVDALAFTSLLPFASRFLINAEMDDTGVVTTGGRCDCVFGRLGMTTVISGISSFGKLTGQGMTLYGTDIMAILERAMPERFGGVPGDYQLVERDLGTQTEVELRVSPRVLAPEADLAPVLDFFLSEMKRYYGGTMAARVWRHAGAIKIVRQQPEATFTGKVLPLALLSNHTHHIGRSDS